MLNRTPQFRAPSDLRLTDTTINRALVIGSCFSQGIASYIHRLFPGAKSDYILYNFSGELPEKPPEPIEQYAFQLVLLPLRTVAPETMFFQLPWNDRSAFEACLAQSEQILLQLLTGALQYNEKYGLTTFVGNYLCPQANAMGRLLPYNDPRNPAWYVRKLNDLIADFVAERKNTYLLNIDEIAASIGRRHLQDDPPWATSHGAYMSDWDWQHDKQRLHPPRPLSETFELRVEDLKLEIWAEVEAMYRTIRQQDSVKIIICDLDDTLWRGVIAEEGTDNPVLVEGWPLGVIEALTYLKRRGTLLAIASKNDESRIRSLWPVGRRLPLESFVSTKINWEPKAQNVAAILQETNLLARNAVFIDDNPVERENVLAAHPGIRVLGNDLYSIRRVLLWSSETQVAEISDESTRRTEMTKSQLERERERKVLPRDEFLRSLQVSIGRESIHGASHPRFSRAFELINKSNQFNTTGKRWTPEEASRFFERGGRFETMSVTDKFTEYGLVGVAVVEKDTLHQYVMSCRVLGLDVEIAFVAALAKTLVQDHGAMQAQVVPTDANILCRDLYERMGFSQQQEGFWRVEGKSSLPVVPGHVALPE
jgi:FkbH-like protein